MLPSMNGAGNLVTTCFLESDFWDFLLWSQPRQEKTKADAGLEGERDGHTAGGTSPFLAIDPVNREEASDGSHLWIQLNPFRCNIIYKKFL